MAEAREWLCIIKSRADLYEELERTIKENHSCAIPEIMAIRIVRASQDYLKWPKKAQTGIGSTLKPTNMVNILFPKPFQSVKYFLVKGRVLPPTASS